MVGAGTDHTQQPGEGGPVIVLVRPQLALNIGMVARAMANFGLSDLRLVAPKGGWPRTDKYREEAEAAAAGALDLLGRAEVFATLEEAVADLTCVYATTARERGQGKPVLGPGDAMADWVAPILAGEKRGLLFGPERTGLDNDEVALADAVVTFPVNSAYGSLNLAQAVLLVAYEWMKHSGDAALPFGQVERSPPAQRGAVLSFFDYLERELTAAGYFKPDDKQPVMRRNLRNIFHRIGLTEQDVRTLRGALVRLVEGPRAERAAAGRRTTRIRTPELRAPGGVEMPRDAKKPSRAPRLSRQAVSGGLVCATGSACRNDRSPDVEDNQPGGTCASRGGDAGRRAIDARCHEAAGADRLHERCDDALRRFRPRRGPDHGLHAATASPAQSAVPAGLRRRHQGGPQEAPPLTMCAPATRAHRQAPAGLVNRIGQPILGSCRFGRLSGLRCRRCPSRARCFNHGCTGGTGPSLADGDKTRSGAGDPLRTVRLDRHRESALGPVTVSNRRGFLLRSAEHVGHEPGPAFSHEAAQIGLSGRGRQPDLGVAAEHDRRGDVMVEDAGVRHQSLDDRGAGAAPDRDGPKTGRVADRGREDGTLLAAPGQDLEHLGHPARPAHT